MKSICANLEASQLANVCAALQHTINAQAKDVYKDTGLKQDMPVLAPNHAAVIGLFGHKIYWNHKTFISLPDSKQALGNVSDPVESCVHGTPCKATNISAPARTSARTS
eukprot:1156507-Pelagomonas_calceolata.AAC.2